MEARHGGLAAQPMNLGSGLGPADIVERQGAGAVRSAVDRDFAGTQRVRAIMQYGQSWGAAHPRQPGRAAMPPSPAS